MMFFKLALRALTALAVSPLLADAHIVQYDHIHNFSSAAITGIHSASAKDERLFVVTQDGLIRILTFPNGANGMAVVLPSPFLNISNLIINNRERGLLGLAFHTNYARNGYFFVNYIDGRWTNASAPANATPPGNTIISRYRAFPPSSNVADSTSGTVMKNISQPYRNHNGGEMQFGPDGFLYIGLGDGGSANDPQGLSQNVNNCCNPAEVSSCPDGTKNCYLGKMLRVDVSDFKSSTWKSPPDNPCMKNSSCFGTNDTTTPKEIWAIGLRNPWRHTFDRETGDMFIADVGQNFREWVHFQPAASTGGENYGWCGCEGTLDNDRTQCPLPTSGTCQNTNGQFEAPIIEYNHDASGGVCIIGGYVYRGLKYLDLVGAYFYADYTSAKMWIAKKNSADGTWVSTSLPSLAGVTTFGEDTPGDIYVGTKTGDVYVINGTNVAPQPTTSSPPTMSPTKAQTFAPISVGVTCPSSYEHTQVLDEFSTLTLEYSIVHENADHNGIFCARLTYIGVAWIAMGRGIGMVGSEPVICKPDERTVMKYLISAQNANGVNPTSQETLISSNFSQTETTTIMEYVMLLKGPSPSDLDIEDGSVNQFVFAYGFGNTFGKHDVEGPFSLDLRTSSPTKVPTPPIPTSDPTTTNPITPNPTTVRPTPKPKRGNGP